MKYISILALALLLGACTTAKPAKEKPFSVDFNSPRIPAGMIEAQFQKIVDIGGLRTIKINVDYYPLEDAVCLRHRLDFMTNYLYLNKENRDSYLKALNQYKEDYANRTLKTNGSRSTRKQYGNAEVYLSWQAFAYTMRGRANTFIDYGYDIRKVSGNRASFFTIFRRETHYIPPATSEQSRFTALNELMYFTRSQADDLAALFDQDYLKSLSLDRSSVSGHSDFDEY